MANIPWQTVWKVVINHMAWLTFFKILIYPSEMNRIPVIKDKKLYHYV